MKLYFFSCGVLHTPRDVFVQKGDHTLAIDPVPYFLIQHKGKNILFDTGIHKDAMNGHLLNRVKAQPDFSPEQRSPAALEKLGIKPEDIDVIIMSHLHWDHAGAITEFPNATVIVQKSEYDYVRRPDYFMTQSYYNDEVPAPVSNFRFDHADALTMKNVDWYFLDGWKDNRFDLFNDGKLIIYFTPGHSVGHQSLLVNTDKDGSFMLAADACYLEANISDGLVPGLVCDSPAYLQNIRTFRLMRKLGVQIVTGHDSETWATFKHAPEYYE